MLSRSAPAAAGGTINYQRGESRVWLKATWGATEFEVTTSGETRIEHSDRDFIFSANDLILNGSRATPQRGDRVIVVMEDPRDNETFEVLAPAGIQPYRTCDPEGHLIRVHGKRIV